jgi:YD repeat-containing protein
MNEQDRFPSLARWSVVALLLAAVLFTVMAWAESYEYDDLNRLKVVRYDDGTTIEYTYDATGNIIKIVTTGSATLFQRGDVNVDGALDLSDGVFIFSYLFTGGPPPSCLKSADTDDNGTLEITDGIRLLSHLFLGAPAPPPPFGECGPDPTEDELSCDSFVRCR